MSMLPVYQDEGDVDSIRCGCGNTPDREGFYPCDAAGNDLESPLDTWNGERWIPEVATKWDGQHWKCDKCGLVFTNADIQIIPR